MAKDVLITPANGIVEFKESGVTQAQIQLDSANNLIISTSNGDVTIGAPGNNLYVGDGINNVDIIFEQNGSVRALSGKTLTIGQTDSSVNVNAITLNLTGNTTLQVDGNTVINTAGFWVGPSSGIQGASGATGPTGATGTLGATGSTGIQGASGSTGLTGATGPQGNVGATGSTGVQGASGTLGATGSTGPQGNVGATGSTGPQGNVGATGSTGVQGASGTLGATGSTGPQGNVGATGSTGPQGNVGATGSTGPQGNVGATGSTGAQGASGSTGIKGGVRYNFSTTTTDADPGTGTLQYNNATIASVTNIFIDELDVNSANLSLWLDTFDDALNSHEGVLTILGNTTTTVNQFNVTGAVVSVTGYKKIPVTYISGTLPSNSEQLVISFSRTGNQGATGSTGPQGNVGATGSTGPQGNVGATGSTGPQGNVGATGSTGPAGASGATGVQGASGSTGIKGGVRYNFSTTTTDADPGTGILRYNNATIASVTNIFIDELDVNSANLSFWFDTFDDALNSHEGILEILGNTTTTVNQFNVTGAIVSVAGYKKIPVTFVSGTLPANNEQLVIGFSRTGNQGATGSTGPQGATGSTGPQGATGLTGATGVQGASGARGATGSTGPQGNVGATGSTGPGANQTLDTTSNVQFRTIGVNTTPDTANAGSIRATGDITSFFSDERLKEEIVIITHAMNKVSSLRGVYYTPNDIAKSFGYRKDRKVGVIAQEVQNVLPEIVVSAPFDTDINGNTISGQNYKTVHYDKLIPLLIEAIKELENRIKVLEEKARINNSD